MATAKARKTKTTPIPKAPAKTEMVTVDELEDGDVIHIEGKWRTFSLAKDSLTVKNHVNIMVKNTNTRFFRVHENDKIERGVRKDD